MNDVDSKNRLLADALQSPPPEVRMPENMMGRLNMHQANVGMAVKGRDGFLEAAKLSLGVPDDWQFDLKRGVFLPPQGMTMEPPQNGGPS